MAVCGAGAGKGFETSRAVVDFAVRVGAGGRVASGVGLAGGDAIAGGGGATTDGGGAIADGGGATAAGAGGGVIGAGGGAMAAGGGVIGAGFGATGGVAGRATVERGSTTEAPLLTAGLRRIE
jgi:hypothetical protein